MLEHRVFQLVDPLLELLDLGTVVVDHRIDDAVKQRHRPFAHQLRVALDGIGELLDRGRVAVVNGDEVVRSEEEVDVVGREPLVAGVKVDAVEDDVEIAVVGFDLRETAVRRARPPPTAGGNAKVSLRISNSGIVGAARSTHSIGVRGGIEPAPIDARDPLGLSVPVDENGDHRSAQPRHVGEPRIRQSR